ncbi:potassium transporter KefA [Lujinxingia litoralis]|uniref:Potassium transporter KefA n=1 Tax=Lujinxingia litoralis TaxID=2211119 RepID=A0A328C772_9DELT|nr:mechanosensitive ion channel domain-containing protein [Lujinxingia litoralis]RAL23805.1 potassium transporter KefA [Lujinxingia litoralis]
MNALQTLVSSLPLLAQAAPDVEEIAQRIELLNLGNLLSAATIIAVAYGVHHVLAATLERLGEGQARRRLFFKKVQSFARLGVFAAAAYLVVATFLDFEEDRAALLGLGGTLAVAIGFALKDTASSLMAGIMILVDQPFQVGDRVAFGDTYGEVVEIGLRSVRIVTLDDNQVSIPNNKFLTEAVSSSNAGALDMMVEIDFYIAQSADFELAKQIVYEATITSRYVFLSKPVLVQVYDEITPLAFATHVKSKAYVIDTRYEKALLCDVMERVKRAFRLHGIHPPYTRSYEVQARQWEDASGEVPGRSRAPLRARQRVDRSPGQAELDEVVVERPSVEEV